MDLRRIKIRVETAAAKLPPATRTPRLCVVTSAEPADVREAKIAEAERLGDPVLEVVFIETPTSPEEFELCCH